MTVRVRYLVTTLALIAVGGGYAVTQGWQHPAPIRPAHVEPASRPAPPAAVPSARDILERRDELKLTGEQRARLEALDRDWTRDSAGIRSSLDAATRAFSSWMEDRRDKGRVPLGEIQQRSDDLRQLSASLRERRRLHADAAARVLTDEQQRELREQTAPQKNPGGMR